MSELSTLTSDKNHVWCYKNIHLIKIMYSVPFEIITERGFAVEKYENFYYFI